jgi:hypothetical protein
MELGADIGWVVLIGFLAQLIDGSIGMGYGITASVFLATGGVPPALASATIHAAEVATTGVSGLSHAWFRNLDRRIFVALLLPGVLGSIAGALLLANVPGEKIRPFVWVYLLVTASLLLARALLNRMPLAANKPGPALGVTAGFLDAVGGGGWGTLVTSSMVARGLPPRYAIGTANAVEFFVASATSVTLWLALGQLRWDLIVALIAGGVLAAPLAAWITRHVPTRAAAIAVGVAVFSLGAGGLYMSLR